MVVFQVETYGDIGHTVMLATRHLKRACDLYESLRTASAGHMTIDHNSYSVTQLSAASIGRTLRVCRALWDDTGELGGSKDNENGELNEARPGRTRGSGSSATFNRTKTSVATCQVRLQTDGSIDFCRTTTTRSEHR
jgi:hypothetical protein